jgi:O-antigen/teichoic acid export membrane protein
MNPASQPIEQGAPTAEERKDSSSKLDKQIKQAYFWTAVITSVKHVATFAISMILARLLSPGDYGLAGMVLAVTAIVTGLQDVGVSQAVVYFRDSEDSLPSFATAAALVALVLTGVAMLLAEPIAYYYAEPRVAPVLRVMSFNILLLGFRAVPQGILQKHLRFRELNLAEMLGLVIGGVLAIVMAYSGWGVWSLVANGLCSTLITVSGLMVLARPRYTLHPDWQALKKLLQWSLPLTGGQVLWRFFDNADYIVVGKVLGPVALGYYTFAFRFATLVHEKLGTVVNRVSFASLAARKDDPGGLAVHWLKITRNVGLVSFPLLAALAMMAPEVVQVLVGDRWSPAVPTLRILCVVGLMRCLLPLTLIMATATGRTDLTFTNALLYAITLPPAFYFGATHGGIVGVGLAWVIVNPIVGGFILSRVLKQVQTSVLDYLSALVPAVVVSAVVVTSLAAAHFAMPLSLGAVSRLIAGSLAAAAAIGAVLLVRRDWYAFLLKRE